MDLFTRHSQIQDAPRLQRVDQIGDHLLIARDMLKTVDRKDKIILLALIQTYEILNAKRDVFQTLSAGLLLRFPYVLP